MSDVEEVRPDSEPDTAPDSEPDTDEPQPTPLLQPADGVPELTV